MSQTNLAIVIPIYNEEAVLPALFERLSATCHSLRHIDWQVVFVNDGSRDQSRRMILEERAREPRFTLLDLSRNFGHQAAISAGLAVADADAVVIMDGDLQDPPEVIPIMIAAWRNGADVVLPVRRSRQDSGFRRVGFAAFHKLFTWISDFRMEGHTGVFCLLDRQAVTEFNRLSERHRFIPGLRAWIGFEQRKIYYDRQERQAGQPKQSLRRLISYAMDGIISFSLKPLRLMSFFGVIVGFIGFALACIFIIKRLIGIETAATGFTTLVSLVLFLGGIQMLGIGLLGEYLGRVYDEAKQRPLYIVKKRYGIVRHQSCDTADQFRIDAPEADLEVDAALSRSIS
ncbi:MAG: glycosyltransferase family 2 protein [Pyrinomonadaceae bacterium]